MPIRPHRVHLLTRGLLVGLGGCRGEDVAENPQAAPAEGPAYRMRALGDAPTPTGLTLHGVSGRLRLGRHRCERLGVDPYKPDAPRPRHKRPPTPS